MTTGTPPSRRIAIVAGLLALIGLAFIVGYVVGGDRAVRQYIAAPDWQVATGDRRADPATGCAAIAAGVRHLLAQPGDQPPEVRAVLLDQLLLNYRNMECGIVPRTELLLEVIGVAGP